MNKSRKLRLALLKYAISFAILGWLFWQAWKSGQFAALKDSQKNYGWLAIALVSGIAVCFVSYFRWWRLGRALDLHFSYRDAVRLGFLGNLLNFLSIGVLGGDAVKAFFLVRQESGRGPEAIASVIFDRVIGLLTMFGCAGVGWLFSGFTSGEATRGTEFRAMVFVCQFSLVASIVGFAGLGVLFLTPRFTKTRLYRGLSRLPRVGGLFKRMTGVALVYRNRFGSVLSAIGLSIIVNLLFAVSFFGVAAGLTTDHPTFRQQLVISPVAMVANAVPLPGGLGGMEAAASYLFRAFSSETVTGDNGFVVAIGFRVVLLITAAIGLGVYLSSRREFSQLPQD